MFVQSLWITKNGLVEKLLCFYQKIWTGPKIVFVPLMFRSFPVYSKLAERGLNLSEDHLYSFFHTQKNIIFS